MRDGICRHTAGIQCFVKARQNRDEAFNIACNARGHRISVRKVITSDEENDELHARLKLKYKELWFLILVTKVSCAL